MTLSSRALVAAEDLQRLIGAGEDARRAVEGLLVALVVHGDDAHLLGHGDDRDRDLAGDPLGGAVPGAGLVGGDVGVGHEVHVGARDPGAVGGEDDRAVHLGQLREALRRELGVEEEAAGADVQDGGSIADDDERAHLRLQDAVDTLTQRSARSHQPQRGVENFRSALRQQILPVGTGSEATPRRAPPRPTPRGDRRPAAAHARGRRGSRPGTIAVWKPSRNASANLLGACGTWRTSPPSPSSPITSVLPSTAVSLRRRRSQGRSRGRRRAR